MILCLCHNISYKDILKLIKANKNISEITSICGAGSSCGACIKTIEEEINKYQKTDMGKTKT